MGIFSGFRNGIQDHYGYNAVIHVSEEGFVINWASHSQSLKWDEIIGFSEKELERPFYLPLRTYHSLLMLDSYHMAPMPDYFRMEGPLTSGYHLDINNEFTYQDAFNSLLKKKATRLNPILARWVRWRLIIPAAAPLALAMVLFHLPWEMAIYVSNEMVLGIALMAIPACLFGWKWEMAARIKYWAGKNETAPMNRPVGRCAGSSGAQS